MESISEEILYEGTPASPSSDIRPSQTAAFPTFAANRKEVLNLSSQEDLEPN